MKTNNLKKVSICLLLLGLGACSASQSSDNQPSVNQANTDSPEVVNHSPQASKRVVIAQISTIPTNLGVSGRSVIRVDNHTGKNLYLKSAGVGVRSDNSFAANSYGALKQSLGSSGSGSNVPNTCEKLLADNHCEVFFTPNEADGSKVLSMLFEDKEGKQYHAAQLIEYSSHVPQQDGGFYLSNEHVSVVVTDSSYSLSIPYVSDGNYKSVKLSSEIGALSQSNTCEDGAVKGTICTAMLTLPAPRVADKNSYNNQISLIGTRSNGTLTRSFITNNVMFNQNGHLIISAGPAIIDARKGNTKVNVNLVNIGVAPISNIAATSSYGERYFEEQTFSAGKDYGDISKTYNCNGVGNSLPTILDPGKSCTVTFTLDRLDATGSEYYKITSTGGASGTATDTIGTRVYYRQHAIPTYGYTLSGDVNLPNTLVGVGGGNEQAITLTNSGKELLQTANNSFSIEPLVSGLSVDPNKSSCLSPTKVLKTDETCTYVISYKPTVAKALTVSKFTVTAKDNKGQLIKPERSISIKTEAVVSSSPDALNLNLTQAESNNLEILANGTESVVREFAVTNNGKKAFTITSITAKGWPTAGLEMVNTANATTSLSNSSNGTYNGSPVRIVAGATIYFAYRYGPVSSAQSGYAEQTIRGTFDTVATNYEYKIITNYSAKTVGITTPGASFVIKESSTLTNTATATNLWHLLKQNRATVTFNYRAGNTDQVGFLVDDADLPYGFMVISSNNPCPTASRGSSRSTLKANDTCTVAYDYLSESLDHSVFYTDAVNRGVVEITQPGYVVQNSSNGVNAVKPDNKISFTPVPFNTVTESAIATTAGTPSSIYPIKYRLTFVGSGFSGLILDSDRIFIKLAIPPGSNVSVDTTSVCDFTRVLGQESCSIDVYKIVAGPVTLPFTYSLSRDSDYNAFNSSVLLN
ncbi:MAG: hypothetical protein K2X04_06985 [Burkholderiales bacterium]|nr:hypothetical protein [Burkholderiales bacterium]